MMDHKQGKERVRSTKRQLDKLVEIMERNPELAKGGGSNRTCFWKNEALKFNSMGPAVKEGADCKRNWIDKKSLVKKKLSHNKKEMQQTGGGKPAMNTLSELEERIAAVTNMRDITNRIEGSLCIGIGNQMEQPGPSHHTQPSNPGPLNHTEFSDLEPSHHIQSSEPGPHHIQSSEPEPSLQTQSSDPGPSQQIQPSEQLEPSGQGKKAKKRPAATSLEEFQKTILDHNDKKKSMS
ncbi:uncharacterized protein LOC128298313 [Anopheles moucheti]|uniref:uncharacterized protein LOC128298313 n=1 Tax=Anopheles moucheti TaxID=186751 RepID=UPI0022F071D3|nr:uncharacterized protein LOC128298313 [Anopheles moucheti]